MSLYRPKGSPFWHFDFQIKRHRFFGSTECENQDDAAAIEAAEKVKARAAIDRGLRESRAPMTIERAANRFWQELGEQLSESGLKFNLDWLVRELGAATRIDAINDDMVSRLVQRRRLDVVRAGRDQDGKQLFRPITARTVNKTTVVLLRRILRRARDNWSVTLLREPNWKKHMLKEARRHVREITPIEEGRLDAAERSEFAVLRRFALLTGLRRGNALLTWSQVDFEAGVIRIMTKGGVPRVLPMSREVYAILWAQRGHHPEFVFTYVCQKTRKIPKGKADRVRGQRYPITAAGWNSAKQRSWKGAGVAARIHDLRHTTGMRTLRQTGNLRAVQKLLGHTDIAVTAKFYTDANLEDLRQTMEATSQVRPAELPPPKTSEGET